jgi:hypothetical protein
MASGDGRRTARKARVRACCRGRQVPVTAPRDAILSAQTHKPARQIIPPGTVQTVIPATTLPSIPAAVCTPLQTSADYTALRTSCPAANGVISGGSRAILAARDRYAARLVFQSNSVSAEYFCLSAIGTIAASTADQPVRVGPQLRGAEGHPAESLPGDDPAGKGPSALRWRCRHGRGEGRHGGRCPATTRRSWRRPSSCAWVSGVAGSPGSPKLRKERPNRAAQARARCHMAGDTGR